LLYKIYEKLKRHGSEEMDLANAIGNEIIRRVSSLLNIVLPDK
jgi:hypothetical protein